MRSKLADAAGTRRTWLEVQTEPAFELDLVDTHTAV